MVDCFECEIKLGWNSPKINGKSMKKVQQLVKFSDNVLDRMNDKDVLCGDCNDKFGKRHALELYNYDKNRLSEKEWVVYLKTPQTQDIIQEAERILAEQTSTSTVSPNSEATASTNLKFSNPTSNTTPTIENMAYSPPTEAKEKIVIIRGSWNTQGSTWKVQEHLNREKDSGIHYTGDLQDRFIEFAKNHDIIDVTPVNTGAGHEIVLVVRYKS